MKTKKIIVAGALVLETIYPRGSAHDSPRQRAAKRKLSSEAQQRMNQKYSFQKLELQLAANYGPGDLWVTLTYDDAHLPSSRAEAEAHFKYFLRKLRVIRGKKSQPVVHWNSEHKHEHDSFWQDRRWHHHFAINATGDDFEQIRSCWIYGSNIEIRRIKLDKDHSYETLARYMCKESRDRPGLRCWSYTRNAKHPEIETFPVPDDTPLQAPKGATVYEEAADRNEYGSYRFVKYLAPNFRRSFRRSRPRPKRRR